jgi:hypothetical protein
LENSFNAGQMNAQQQQEEMTPDGIKKLMEELINLPLSGEEIKKFMDAEKRGLNSQASYDFGKFYFFFFILAPIH